MKYGLTKYEDPTRRLRVRVNVLYAVCLLLLATGLYAAHRYTIARDAAWKWYYQAVSGGRGDGL